MKRAKRIYLLLGVLVVVCAAAFAVVHHQEETERIANTDQVILEIDPDTVDTLSWSYDTESFAFHKDGQWCYDGDDAFPVDQDKIGELLDLFQSFGASFIIEDVTDYGQYGLDDPECTIDLTAGDTSYEIQLGAFSTMDSQRYVSIGDGNVYLVSVDPMDSFEVTLSDLIQQDEVPAFDQVSSLQFTGADSYEADYREENTDTFCEDDAYFVQRDGAWLPLDTDLVQDYLDTLENLDLTDYVTYNATDDEVRSCGLDDPEMTVTVAYTAEDDDGAGESGTFTLAVSRAPDQRDTAVDQDTDAEDITAYVRVGDSPILYQISGTSYQDLMACTYNDLRHQEVFTASFDAVTSLEVELEGQTYTLTAKGSGDDKTLTYNGEEQDPADLKAALEGLTASSFTDETPTQKEEIRLTIAVDNDNVGQVEIAFYRYDGEQCLAEVDGEPTCLVPRTAVVDLIEAINAIVL